MGYTHSWKQNRDFKDSEWDLITNDFKKLLENLPESSESAGGFYSNEPLKIVGVEGKVIVKKKNGTILGLPQCNEYEISFNGGGGELIKNNPGHRPYYELSHEGFRLTKSAQVESAKLFCKTDRKPYDLIVCAVLISAKIHSPKGIIVRSSGELEDWTPALKLVRKILAPTWDSLAKNRFTKAYLFSNWLDYAGKIQNIGIKTKNVLSEERV